ILSNTEERQSRIGIEMIHIQYQQQKLQNKHDPLFLEYQEKQQKLAEQQELQSPESLKTFYNTIEKILGSRLSSAMNLASGIMKGAQINGEKVISMGGKVVKKVLECIPIIGPLTSSIIDIGESIFRINQDIGESKSIEDCLIRLEDCLNLSE